CRPVLRSTVGPQPDASRAEATTARIAKRAGARMRAILAKLRLKPTRKTQGRARRLSVPLEYPHLDPLQRLFARDLAGEKGRQIRSAQTKHERAGVAVGRREPR